MRRVLSGFGVGIGSLVCLAAVILIIALSVFMNGYFAFGRLGGDVLTLGSSATNVAPLIAAGVVAAIDVLKAFAPLFTARAFAHGKYLYVAASAMLLVGAMALSMLAAYGLIIEQRSGVTSERVAQMETKSSLQTQLEETRARITALGFVRPAAAIEAELAAQRQHQRWSSSNGCADATVRASREFCTAYNELQAELAKAQTREADVAWAGVLTKRLDAITVAGGTKAADPQLQSLATATGWNRANIEVGMLLLVAVMIEFVSAFGLYLALGHGPKTPPQAATPALPEPPAQAAAHVPQTKKPSREAVMIESVAEKSKPTTPTQLDCLDAFARYGVACLERVDGAAVAVSDLHADYQTWSRAHGEMAMNQRQFADTIKQVAEHVVEIELTVQNRKKVLRNMQLRKRLAAA